MDHKAKKKIQALRNLIRRCEDKITDIADTFLVGNNRIPVLDMTTGEVIEGMYDDAQWFFISTAWDCPKSPFGWCMYHKIHDEACDGCVFCHEPYERK